VRQAGDFRRQPLDRHKTPSPTLIGDYRVFYDRLTAGSRLSKQPDRFRPISDFPAFSIITVRAICGGRATIPLLKEIGLYLYEAGQTDLFL